jgi:hypothetical protein
VGKHKKASVPEIEVDPLKQDAKRRYLFLPCKTKQDLKNWIWVYLGMDYPDGRVDPSSNSDPMSLIWEIYEAGFNNKRDWDRILAYAARGAFKTLSASILEVLFMLHMNHNIAHMSALEAQARNCQEYIKKFFKLPILRDFIHKENEREIFIARYLDPVTNMSFTELEFRKLPPEVKARAQNINVWIKIIVATANSANGLHTGLFVEDELDLIRNKEAHKEAKYIPTVEHGLLPVTLLTSTRKYSIGMVQAEIDHAAETGLQVRHFNILDVTEFCPSSRYRPEKGKIPIYRSDKLLKAISEEDYKLLEIETQAKYVEDSGHWGCLNECKLFAACQGRLIDQTCRSPMLKSIQHVTQLFQASDAEKARAQLLCAVPSKEGMIYPNLDPEIHMKTPAQIATMITGGEEFSEHFTKKQLIELAQSMECRFVSGMDHGYTHNFAVCTGFIYGNRLFIFDAFAIPQLEISQKLAICEERIKPYNPVIYPDPEDPGSRKTFQKHGFICKDFKKYKGSVLEGIDRIRFKLSPSLGGEPELFFLKGDEGVLGLFGELAKYHWIIGPDEKPTDVPDDDEDDQNDALRYLVINEFPARRQVTVDKEENEKKPQELPQNTLNNGENFIDQWLQTNGIAKTDENGNQIQKTSGSVKWII